MTVETILTNAILVLPDETLFGTIVMRGKTIASIQAGRSSAAGAIDLNGDTVIPGVVDVHTDNLERQVQPRSLARWPSRSAMVAHDAQCAAAGVTTVLDALCLGDLGFDKERIQTFREGVIDLDALTEAGLLKSDHFLHLRCEIPALDMLELFDPVADHPLVRMISLMDHSPGVGQYANMDFYRKLRRQGGLDEATVDRRIGEMLEQRARWRDPNRKALLDRVRGGSHSGNVSAADLVRAGAVDAFASDYVPPSLVEAAFQVNREVGLSLSEAVAMISDHPARMSNLSDRGRLDIGLRADLVRVHLHGTLPIVRQVWRTGERVI